MDFLRKLGFFFLLLGVLSDFLTPYVLGLYYPELDQMKSVISVFGEVFSPVRKAFLIWSVVSGIFSSCHCLRCMLHLQVYLVC